MLKQHNLLEVLLNLFQVTKIPMINWNDSIEAPKNFVSQIKASLAEFNQE
ncbi:hypothetical protein [Paucilactobacillus hokkaidonensis]|nr:hypothetical protein [Paucilactobacillus hokkaidonensis]